MATAPEFARQAVTELNFQSPETVNSWYRRWSDEFDASELEPAFWRWQTRFTSLRDLRWLLCAHAPCMRLCMKSVSSFRNRKRPSLRGALAGTKQTYLQRIIDDMALFAALEVTFSVSRVEVLASEQVEEGQPAPASVMDLWVAGAGYAVCTDFCGDKPIRRWSEEQKLQLADAIWRKEYIVPPTVC
nr:plasmid SOS inhibition protein A [Klebsiella pneumoniae]